MRYSSLSLLVASVLAASAAHANFNTITFDGEVSSQTCEVAIDGIKDGMLKLPTVTQADLSKTGDTAGLHSFEMTFDKCDPGQKNQEIQITFKGKNVSNGGNLQNISTTQGAENVAVQLLIEGTENTPIDFKKQLTDVKTGIFTKDAAGKSATFNVQYIAEAEGVKAGEVKAVVEYQLTYL